MKRLMDPDVCILPECLCPHGGIVWFLRTSEWLEGGETGDGGSKNKEG